MIVDSVFSELLPPAPFPDDKPLIPANEILSTFERIESASVSMQMRIFKSNTSDLLEKADRFLLTEDVAGIASLTWNAGIELQSPLLSTWASGWASGSQDALAEMRVAIPKPAKEQAQQFALSPIDLLQIAALLKASPTLLTGSVVEQAVLQRVIVLAGDFAGDTLLKLKGDLIAAIVPQPGTGQPISRRDLLARIQKTLGVAEQRAVSIARTELTQAYNTARVNTMLSSSLVTHMRFLAISDARTSPICRSRNGMLIPATDTVAIANNKPALHVRCRSVLSPVMSTVNPRHAEWVSDPKRDYRERELSPLPKGWRT
jgi:SPP1 gp7 family putative phage head morphogenesis protein